MVIANSRLVPAIMPSPQVRLRILKNDCRNRREVENGGNIEPHKDLAQLTVADVDLDVDAAGMPIESSSRQDVGRNDRPAVRFDKMLD
jgi:hypothetical protein